MGQIPGGGKKCECKSKKGRGEREMREMKEMKERDMRKRDR